MNSKDVYLPRNIINDNVRVLFAAGLRFFCLYSSLETTACSIFSHNVYGYHRQLQFMHPDFVL